jgi:hypothetical protein
MEEWKAAADQLTGSPDYIHEQLRAAGFTMSREATRHYIKGKRMPDKKEYTDADVDEYITAMLQLQKKQMALDTRQTSATYESGESKPIGIAAWGDWHVGGIGVDYGHLEADGEKIASTDGLYWGGMGDYKDNYQTGIHPGAEKEQIIRPGMQDKIVERYFDRYGDNNIWIIKGCHDDWDYKNSDKDFVSALCNKTGAFNLWHGGTVTVKVGVQQYIFRVRHKFPFESGLNIENSMRRMWDMKGEFDVAGSAHLHTPYRMQRPLGGKNRVLFRSGSYKIFDEYGQKLAGYEGMMGIPVVILWPDTHKMEALYLDEAITMLKALRS